MRVTVYPTSFVIAMQEVVNNVFLDQGLVNSNLSNAGTDTDVSTDPKLIRSSDEIRFPKVVL